MCPDGPRTEWATFQCQECFSFIIIIALGRTVKLHHNFSHFPLFEANRLVLWEKINHNRDTYIILMNNYNQHITAKWVQLWSMRKLYNGKKFHILKSEIKVPMHNLFCLYPQTQKPQTLWISNLLFVVAGMKPQRKNMKAAPALTTKTSSEPGELFIGANHWDNK